MIKKYNNLKSFISELGHTKKCPAIIKNYANVMPAYSKWNLEYLSNTFNNIQLPYEDYTHSSDIIKTKTKQTTFKNYTKIIDRNSVYLAQINILKTCNKLADDVEIPGYINKLPQVSLYFGPQNIGTSLHYDYGDNIYCNLQGQKEFILINPDQHIKTKKNKEWKHFACDTIDCKLIKNDCITLSPGDSLFIPKGYWHQVKNITKSLGLSIMYN